MHSVFESIRDWKYAKARSKILEKGSFVSVEDLFMYMVCSMHVERTQFSEFLTL